MARLAQHADGLTRAERARLHTERLIVEAMAIGDFTRTEAKRLTFWRWRAAQRGETRQRVVCTWPRRRE